MTLSPEDELREHCRVVMRLMLKGDLVPFFGAGVNLSGRPEPAVKFTVGGKYLPNGAELAESIAKEFNYPWDDKSNLLRVSWYVDWKRQRQLNQYLHDIFSADYDPTPVHKFFAQLPKALAKKGYPNGRQLIVTTNYDEVLERAFDDAKEPYDVLSYVQHSSNKEEEGRFRYFPHGGAPQIITDPDKVHLPIDDNVLERTIILKIHGAVNKRDWHASNFVVTEDDYIDYLARKNNPSRTLPTLLLQKMQDSNFLFLGYSLSDWNLRVFLHSIWSEQTFSDTSWAIMSETMPWDEAYWDKHQVELKKLSLTDYVNRLIEQLDDVPISGSHRSV